MRQILEPTNCPGCGSLLEHSNHLLYCRNPDCGQQASKKIEHFAKTLKIKGLGPAAIAKLNLSGLDELYTLSQDQIAESLNSEKLAEKLFAEIENSRSAPLNLVLPAFSIPLIGKTATEKLSFTCEDIYSITEETCIRAGLGPKATANLLEWLQLEFFGTLEFLPFSFKFSKSTTAEKAQGVVCITGKLKSFKTKAEAAAVLASLGYETKDSLTKSVTILVNESGVESAKTKQARDSGVVIVNDLLTFIGEHK